MSLLLGTELWDKPESILNFNENNSLIIDKFQKVITDYLKSHLTNTISQKKIIEKYLTDNECLKTSQFCFASNSYFLTEQILEFIKANETFCEALFTEFDDVVKNKSLNIKKDTRLLRCEMKTLSDELGKENQKLDNDFKRYRTRFNAKDTAYNAYLKADANKALSRNQVENFHTSYNSRNKQYEETKEEYLVTLDNFNKYQTKHYSLLMREWGQKAQTIENEHYNLLKATFTNLLEVFKSMSSKFNNIADKIESMIETIECEKDCSILINQEKSGDVPPMDVPFKNFDLQEKSDTSINEEIRISKTSNSGSEYSSVNNQRKSSITDTPKSIRSQSLGIFSVSKKESIHVINGSSTSGIKRFGKLFGGSKKAKEPLNETIQTESEHFETLLEEKGNQLVIIESNPEIKEDVTDIKDNLKILKKDCSTPKNSNSLSRIDAQIENSDKEVSNQNVSSTKEMSLFKRLSRGSMRCLSDKRRSRSVISIMMGKEKVENMEDISVNCENNSCTTLKPAYTKRSQKPSMRAQSISGNRERFGSGTINSRCIEVIRSEGKVEIVSTPAEALACAARESSMLGVDQDIYDEISPDTVLVQSKATTTYDYYYVGSCVAMHEYQSTDPSNIYLSFEIGQQFYIIKEDDASESSGWLLVEKIDRTQLGYVPASYMDTRQFDVPVRIYSDHPMVLS